MKADPIKNLSPDDVYVASNKGTTFLYTKDHHLWHYPIHYTHTDIAAEKPVEKNIFKLAGSKFRIYGRDRLLELSLLGRIGKVDGVHACSFWNSELMTELLKPCLQALVRENLINENTVVVLPPWNNPVPLKDFIGQPPRKLTQKEKEEVEKKRQVHLLRGNEKKYALAGAGYTPPTPSSHQYGLSPGQKYWAMDSEGFSFKDWLLQ